MGGVDGGARFEFIEVGEFFVDAGADDDVAADAEAGGDGGALSDDGDTGVDDIGPLAVGDVGVAGADDAAGADGDLFIEDAAVDDGAGADDAAVLDDGFADDGAGFDDDAGGDDGAVDLAVDAGRGEMSDSVTRALGPKRAGGGMEPAVRSFRSGSSRSSGGWAGGGPCGRPSRTRWCRHRASSRGTGSRRRGGYGTCAG